MGYRRSFSDTIARRAQTIVARCGTRDPFAIAEQLGAEVLYVDSLNRLKGMYRVIKRNRFIFLNAKNSPQMNRIVCAHELGHDQLHREFACAHALKEFMLYDMATRPEYEANLFAADLLLEDETILGYVEQGYDSAQIAAMTETDINLVALKIDGLIRRGHTLRRQVHSTGFLQS